jgi:hypothetical protein
MLAQITNAKTWCGILLLAFVAMPTSGNAQPSNPSVEQIVPLSAAQLYQGWRASRVLGQPVVSRTGSDLGKARNLILHQDGQIDAVVIEGRTAVGHDYVFRLPWRKLQAQSLPGRLVADVTNAELPEFGMFPGKASVTQLPSEFAVTEIIGDYARLQTGQAYGYASDVVFTDQGRMLAVLITRDSIAGGGVHAFAFPGTTGRWNPGGGYYGLPYVTADQAARAAVSVDARRFKTNEAG